MSQKAEWMQYRALVVGCGSIGRRHAKNLRGLGVRQLAFCDVNAEALQFCTKEVMGERFSDYGTALKEFNPDFVVMYSARVSC